MKGNLVAAIAAVTVSTAFAGPGIVENSVSISQDAATRKVTVSYSLTDSEPAIVTIDIQTNSVEGGWVSIGGRNLGRFAGDVNKLVAAGSECTATWQADAAWPQQVVTDGVRAVVTAWATNAPPDYLAIDLSSGDRRYYACAESVPGGVENDLYKTAMMLMRKIPAAGVEWRMGAGSSAECGASDFAAAEKPHLVTLSADYYIGVYPVTQRQYYLIYRNGNCDIADGEYPSSYAGANRDVHPVENICYTYLRGSSVWPDSGHEIAARDMRRMVGCARTVTGLKMDLPTEAQWEFAARAGCGYAYVDGTSVWKDSLGWTSSNEPAGSSTRPVGGGTANAWGLYDLHGNVWELCLDWYSTGYYAESAYRDPPGAATDGVNTQRTTRGGGYSSPSSSARLSKRGYSVYNVKHNATGFRFVCPAVVPGE